MKTQKQKGYFLVEIMVSLSIFTLVAVSTTGALLALIDANLKAQGLKSVMDNLNVAVENMSRVIRVGTNYSCSVQSSGDCDPAVGVSFSSAENANPLTRDVTYYLKTDPTSGKGAIYRTLNGVDMPMTAPEVNITGLRFRLFGTGTADGQPRVFISVSGSAGLTVSAQSRFVLQTTISQRLPDANL